MNNQIRTIKPEKPVLVLYRSMINASDYSVTSISHSKVVSTYWEDDDDSVDNGLLGWLYGMGSLSEEDCKFFRNNRCEAVNIDPSDYLWFVLEVTQYKPTFKSDSKIRFKEGVTKYVGKLHHCGTFLINQAKSPLDLRCMVGSVNVNNVEANTGDGSYSETGDFGKAQTGKYGIARSGYKGDSRAGKYGIAISGNQGESHVYHKFGICLSGDNGYAISGQEGRSWVRHNNSQATSGYRGISISGNDYSSALSGKEGISIVGNDSHASTGYQGMAAAGTGGTISVIGTTKGSTGTVLTENIHGKIGIDTDDLGNLLLADQLYMLTDNLLFTYTGIVSNSVKLLFMDTIPSELALIDVLLPERKLMPITFKTTIEAAYLLSVTMPEMLPWLSARHISSNTNSSSVSNSVTNSNSINLEKEVQAKNDNMIKASTMVKADINISNTSVDNGEDQVVTTIKNDASSGKTIITIVVTKTVTYTTTLLR